MMMMPMPIALNCHNLTFNIIKNDFFTMNIYWNPDDISEDDKYYDCDSDDDNDNISNGYTNGKHHIAIEFDIKQLCCEQTNVKIINENIDDETQIYRTTGFDLSDYNNFEYIIEDELEKCTDNYGAQLYINKYPKNNWENKYGIYAKCEVFTIDFDNPECNSIHIVFSNIDKNGSYPHNVYLEHLDENDNCVLEYKSAI
jgi:hypothetical protein